jgi:membrane associated rhomboid family serine protease
MNYRPLLNNIPPVVKNLIIINVLFMIATWVVQNMGIDLVEIFGMHNPMSDKFRLHQVFTYMFMHGGLTHIFFNMFALYMFGRVLESVWGPKRFLIYYVVTGLGALALHVFVSFIELNTIQNAIEAFQNAPSAEQFYEFITKYQNQMENLVYQDRSTLYDKSLSIANAWFDNPESSMYIEAATSAKNAFYSAVLNTPTVGASGAVFGVLLAFGMLFPNTQLMLLFPPIPIKAKYFVIGYGVVELYLGFSQSGGNVAHFAHLGGMLFGYFMIKYWNKNSTKFY